MMNLDPSQPQEIPSAYQPTVGQSPQPQQTPMTNPLLPQQSTVGQWPMPYQAPTDQLTQPYQPTTGPLPLRQRYTPEQIDLYFFPFPDRGPKIRQLKQKREALYKQIAALALATLILLVLLLGSAGQGVTYLGIFELVGIIGAIILISRIVKTRLRPLNEELRQELAADAREKEYTKATQPPHERQYDEWIDAISNEIYNKAPTSLHLHEHPDHKTWRQSVSEGFSTLPLSEPEEFGASLFLEGRIARSDEADEHPSQLQKETSKSLRIIHYSVYVFTALFITEDYIAIYTNTVNLRDSTRDREEFEYCYHQHLSHMLLNVDTTLFPGGIHLKEQIALKDSTLSLTFDSSRTIRRNISTLHVGNESITKIAHIHEKLTKALIDHEKSMIRSMGEARSLEC